jgi:putative flippase GtrA
VTVEKREAFSFLCVGVTGFLADAGMLIVLFHWAGADIYLSRLLAFIFAVTVTWILNRTYTFQAKSSVRLHHEYLRYMSTQIGGAAINFGVYAVCLHFSTLMSQWPVTALATGSVVAMAFNFLAMKFLVFKPAA